MSYLQPKSTFPWPGGDARMHDWIMTSKGQTCSPPVLTDHPDASSVSGAWRAPTQQPSQEQQPSQQQRRRPDWRLALEASQAARMRRDQRLALQPMLQHPASSPASEPPGLGTRPFPAQPTQPYNDAVFTQHLLSAPSAAHNPDGYYPEGRHSATIPLPPQLQPPAPATQMAAFAGEGVAPSTAPSVDAGEQAQGGRVRQAPDTQPRSPGPAGWTSSSTAAGGRGPGRAAASPADACAEPGAWPMLPGPGATPSAFQLPAVATWGVLLLASPGGGDPRGAPGPVTTAGSAKEELTEGEGADRRSRAHGGQDAAASPASATQVIRIHTQNRGHEDSSSSGSSSQRRRRPLHGASDSDSSDDHRRRRHSSPSGRHRLRPRPRNSSRTITPPVGGSPALPGAPTWTAGPPEAEPGSMDLSAGSYAAAALGLLSRVPHRRRSYTVVYVRDGGDEGDGFAGAAPIPPAGSERDPDASSTARAETDTELRRTTAHKAGGADHSTAVVPAGGGGGGGKEWGDGGGRKVRDPQHAGDGRDASAASGPFGSGPAVAAGTCSPASVSPPVGGDAEPSGGHPHEQLDPAAVPEPRAPWVQSRHHSSRSGRGSLGGADSEKSSGVSGRARGTGPVGVDMVGASTASGAGGGGGGGGGGDEAPEHSGNGGDGAAHEVELDAMTSAMPWMEDESTATHQSVGDTDCLQPSTAGERKSADVRAASAAPRAGGPLAAVARAAWAGSAAADTATRAEPPPPATTAAAASEEASAVLSALAPPIRWRRMSQGEQADGASIGGGGACKDFEPASPRPSVAAAAAAVVRPTQWDDGLLLGGLLLESPCREGASPHGDGEELWHRGGCQDGHVGTPQRRSCEARGGAGRSGGGGEVVDDRDNLDRQPGRGTKAVRLSAGQCEEARTGGGQRGLARARGGPGGADGGAPGGGAGLALGHGGSQVAAEAPRRRVAHSPQKHHVHDAEPRGWGGALEKGNEAAASERRSHRLGGGGGGGGRAGRSIRVEEARSPYRPRSAQPVQAVASVKRARGVEVEVEVGRRGALPLLPPHRVTWTAAAAGGQVAAGGLRRGASRAEAAPAAKDRASPHARSSPAAKSGLCQPYMQATAGSRPLLRSSKLGSSGDRDDRDTDGDGGGSSDSSGSSYRGGPPGPSQGRTAAAAAMPSHQAKLATHGSRAAAASACSTDSDPWYWLFKTNQADRLSGNGRARPWAPSSTSSSAAAAAAAASASPSPRSVTSPRAAARQSGAEQVGPWPPAVDASAGPPADKADVHQAINPTDAANTLSAASHGTGRPLVIGGQVGEGRETARVDGPPRLAVAGDGGRDSTRRSHPLTPPGVYDITAGGLGWIAPRRLWRAPLPPPAAARGSRADRSVSADQARLHSHRRPGGHHSPQHERDGRGSRTHRGPRRPASHLRRSDGGAAIARGRRRDDDDGDDEQWQRRSRQRPRESAGALAVDRDGDGRGGMRSMSTDTDRRRDCRQRPQGGSRRGRDCGGRDGHGSRSRKEARERDRDRSGDRDRDEGTAAERHPRRHEGHHGQDRNSHSRRPQLHRDRTCGATGSRSCSRSPDRRPRSAPSAVVNAAAIDGTAPAESGGDAAATLAAGDVAAVAAVGGEVLGAAAAAPPPRPPQPRLAAQPVLSSEAQGGAAAVPWRSTDAEWSDGSLPGALLQLALALPAVKADSPADRVESWVAASALIAVSEAPGFSAGSSGSRWGSESTGTGNDKPGKAHESVTCKVSDASSQLQLPSQPQQQPQLQSEATMEAVEGIAGRDVPAVTLAVVKLPADPVLPGPSYRPAPATTGSGGGGGGGASCGALDSDGSAAAAVHQARPQDAAAAAAASGATARGKGGITPGDEAPCAWKPIGVAQADSTAVTVAAGGMVEGPPSRGGGAPVAAKGAVPSSRQLRAASAPVSAQPGSAAPPPPSAAASVATSTAPGGAVGRQPPPAPIQVIVTGPATFVAAAGPPPQAAGAASRTRGTSPPSSLQTLLYQQQQQQREHRPLPDHRNHQHKHQEPPPPQPPPPPQQKQQLLRHQQRHPHGHALDGQGPLVFDLPQLLFSGSLSALEFPGGPVPHVQLPGGTGSCSDATQETVEAASAPTASIASTAAVATARTVQVAEGYSWAPGTGARATASDPWDSRAGSGSSDGGGGSGGLGVRGGSDSSGDRVSWRMPSLTLAPPSFGTEQLRYRTAPQAAPATNSLNHYGSVSGGRVDIQVIGGTGGPGAGGRNVDAGDGDPAATLARPMALPPRQEPQRQQPSKPVTAAGVQVHPAPALPQRLSSWATPAPAEPAPGTTANVVHVLPLTDGTGLEVTVKLVGLPMAAAPPPPQPQSYSDMQQSARGLQGAGFIGGFMAAAKAPAEAAPEQHTAAVAPQGVNLAAASVPQWTWQASTSHVPAAALPSQQYATAAGGRSYHSHGVGLHAASGQLGTAEWGTTGWADVPHRQGAAPTGAGLLDGALTRPMRPEWGAGAVRVDLSHGRFLQTLRAGGKRL